jgi:hypothetical protein
MAGTEIDHSFTRFFNYFRRMRYHCQSAPVHQE